MTKKHIRILSLINALTVAMMCIGTAASAYIPAFSEDDDEEERICELVVTDGEGTNDAYFIDENGSRIESELTSERVFLSELPSKYTLYDEGKGTSVKNQGKENICWTYAGMACVESNLIINGSENNSVDLSEKHLAWFTNGRGPVSTNDPLYGDYTNALGTGAYNKGGNIFDVAAVLARGSGPVYEEVVPTSTTEPLPESLRYASLYPLKDMNRYDSKDILSIKNALVRDGAVFTSYYESKGFYDSEHYSYYCNISGNTVNHGVAIVGWDDDYPASDFLTAAPANGAWIVKNSWGESWGYGGFFYMSYYNDSMGSMGSFSMGEYGGYDHTYQYDGNYRSGARYTDNSITGANIFTAFGNENIDSVSFWTNSADIPYVISIYTDIPQGGSPVSGTLQTVEKGVQTYAGYHTVELTSPVPIDSGSDFSVVVTLDTPSTVMYLDSNAVQTGRSFYGRGTSPTSWVDPAVKYNKNVCIKAHTSDRAAEYIPLTAEYFPDSSFRNAVSKYDKDSDGYINKTERASITSLNLQYKGISDLRGIGYLKELENLTCNNNSITSLDLSGNTALRTLICGTNPLEKLNISRCTGLTYLSVTDAGLDELDITSCSELTIVYCSGNELTSLDLSQNGKLTHLYCSDNSIRRLDLDSTPALICLDCRNNCLSYLDTSPCSITYFMADGNVRNIGDVKDCFYLSQLGDIQWEKISDLSGASLNTTSQALEKLTSLTVTYTYDCSNGLSQQFTLCADSFSVTDDTAASGQCGSSAYWKISDSGVLTIYGSGNMYSGISDKSEWGWYGQSFDSLVIEEGITSVGAYAFFGSDIASVSLPHSLSLVEKNAFASCSKLHGAEIPDSVESIGVMAFCYTDMGSVISLPRKLKTLGYSAFTGHSGYTVSEDNEYFKAVDGVLFSKDGSVLTEYPPMRYTEQYTVPEGVVSIGKINLSAVSDILILPSSLTEVGSVSVLAARGVPDIYGYHGSYAAQFAARYNCPFVCLDRFDILTDVQNVTVVSGEDAVLSFDVSGAFPTFLWEVNDGSGWKKYGTSDSGKLTVSKVSYAMNGYRFRCTASNTYGASITSAEAVLTAEPSAEDIRSMSQQQLADYINRSIASADDVFVLSDNQMLAIELLIG